MTEHTPGPWHFDGAHEVETTTNKGIAHVWSQYQTSEGRFANARLIAAAPDMLDALRAQHNAMDTMFALLIEADTSFRPSQSGQLWYAMVQSNTAIAAATGDGEAG